MTRRSLALSQRQATALDSDLALKLFSACSDLALLVGEDDVIHDAASNGASRLAAAAADWVGRRWSDVVTSESRPKVEALLQEARTGGPGVARQVNHVRPGGPDIPLVYSAAGLEATSSVIALGRDMGPMAQMQQRLIQAQQTLERDYARLMEMERRYRMLFQVTSTGVLVVEAQTGEILEANRAAVELLAPGALRITGRRFPEGFDRVSTQALTAAMAGARAQGAVEDMPARRLDDSLCHVSLHFFHESGAGLLLVRIAPPGQFDAAPAARTRLLAECLQVSPDGFAALGPDGRILHANAAFVSAVHAPGEEAVRRQPLERYLGRSAVDLDVLMASLREGAGGVRAFATTLRTEDGLRSEVEVSAAGLPGGAPLAFFIRDVTRRLADEPGETTPATPEQASELVGRMPLKDIVGRTSDQIEELCIRRALELTGDNRAAAAELLGLSRQTLYAKLRRLGFDEETPAT